MGPRARPVLWWATLGAAAVALATHAYLAWISSDRFRATPTGPDPVPRHVEVSAVVFQAVMVTGAVATIGWVVRGCRREGRLTVDGKLLLAWLSMLWLDPVANHLRPQFLFSSAYVNRGSWVEHLPGWQSVGGHLLPNSLLVEVPAYAILVMTSVLGCRVMERVRSRRPELGALPLCLVVLAVFQVVFLLFGMLLVSIGFAAWPRALPYVTFGAGQWWQYPLSETTMFGAVCTAMAGVRFFRPDPTSSSAPTFVERGVDRLALGRRARTAVGVLALAGYGNAAMLGYAAVKVPIAVLVDPVDHDYPSHLRSGICGPGTPYDC